MRLLFVLLGDPVAHSRSPAIHARAFELLGVDACYAPCHVQPEELAAAIDGLRVLGVAGGNVTVPHKEAVLELLDRVDQRAEIIGAVNCLLRDPAGQLVGFNTDVAGVLNALRGADVELRGAHTVVLGAGGSARAAAVAVAPMSGRVTILNRTEANARNLAAVLRDADCLADVGPLEGPEARRVLSRADVVINCTTVGMGTGESPIDVSLLPEGTAVLDLVYAGPPGTPPGETALYAAARARGLRAVDGLNVLVHQAVASLEVWLGRPHLASARLASAPRGLVSELRAAALAEPADRAIPSTESA
jgi:shikimate dehydrogenase